MKIDKVKLYILEILLLIILVLALFESNIISRTTLAIILAIYAFLLNFFLKKRGPLSIYNKQVLLLNVGFAILYVATFYAAGLYFGFYEAPVKFNVWGITNFILPITVIIISSEIIRYILISQKAKFGKFLAFISMVLIDVKIYSGIYDVAKLNGFLVIIGFILFAAISSNLLYNYISKRYGCKSIIAYRLITVLYGYIIPIIPDVMVFFKSIGRMAYPYIMYMTLEYTYSKNQTASDFRNRKKRLVGTTLTAIFMLLIAMLISCQFTFGILVVGSGSMSGTIDKGDAVIFKSYNNEPINVDDVIIFNKNNSQIIHRVIRTEIFNDEYRYYTKGDANTTTDNWYITKSDIVGVSKFRIKYLGYPTIWVNDLFKKK